ncbi:hypothetical protein [Natranaerofaba carboxydovora]|uniref:hypothetical protein n=1 Tax=Natranaerofaba carboxydovora TaxID=2742683 RepID=UPI001F145541|nr:hypothetical protein [Natranaerofaba carboxydovora]UMZ74901.1 hypothetical protein ACONDI_02505 [Natranaerofaba carboxydovora]
MFSFIYRKLEGVYVVYFSVCILVLSFLMVYFFDLQNAFGVRDFFVEQYDTWPFFWYHWFKNGGPIEIIQYLFLGLASLVSIRNASIDASINNNNTRHLKNFWYLMGFALLLMLIEDAGDPRHTIRIYVQAIVGEEEQGFFGTMTELIYFCALAFFPIYAFLRYGGRTLYQSTKTKIYFLIGFLFYAMATGASFAGSAFHSLIDKNFYMITGRYLLDILVTLGDQKTAELYSVNKDWISFYLMDSPVEESLELLGASLLLAACISYGKGFILYNYKKE